MALSPKVPVSVSRKGMTFRLDGTKVTRPQQPGIYIIDGQKRWVK